MGVPCLTATQYAYLFHQETFLNRIQERAHCLARDGYSVEPTETHYVFLVLCPKRVNAYRVHAIQKTCACPFYAKQVRDEPLTHDGSIVLCKHLVGLKPLIRKTRERLLRDGETCEGYQLWAHYLAVLALERLQEGDTPAANGTIVAAHMTKGEVRDEPDNPELSRRAGARSG